MVKHKATYSNGMSVIQEADGSLRLVKAQFTDSESVNMPLDTTKDNPEGPDVPRDESVGLKQTEPKEIPVYDYPYQLGDKGSDEEIIPRTNKDDGAGGKSVTFESEKADGYTSGDPDNYIQKLQPVVEKTPAGNKKNHAVASVKNSSSVEEELIEIKKALELERKLRQQAETSKDRDKLARKIAYTELEKGLIACDNEEEFENRVAQLSKDPVPVLVRDLERVRNWKPSAISQDATSTMTTTANTTNKLNFSENGSVTLQSLGSFANHRTSDVPEISSNVNSLQRLIEENTKLGRQFPNAIE